MPRKGMRSLLFQFSSPSNSISRYSISSPSRSPAASTPRASFNDAMIEQSVESAAAIVMKWNPDSSTYAKVTSMFYEDKREAMQFIKHVNDLQKAMHLMVSEDYSGGSTSDRLVYAQGLMEIAMKRLQKEFYQILSMNRAHLDPESISTRSSRCSTRSSTTSVDFDDEDEIQAVDDSISEVEHVSFIVMEDLRIIAECMISSGYAKECVTMYKVIRKSIIDEGVYRLGIEKLSQSRINKMDWEMLDLKIKNWLDAIKLSIRTLFVGERVLCDHVFSSSESISESCFADISREGALLLFEFPEIVAKSKKSPEKMFRVLDMYSSVAENWAEIESIFASESTSVIRSQALTSLTKLGELVRAIVMDLELSIQKNSSKSPVSGGGVHSLTLLSMNYLTFLADYGNVLTDIFADWIPIENSSLDHIFFGSSESSSDESTTTTGATSASPISLRLGWLILVLLCKLDSKAKHYKDVSLSYLFLANNLQHIVSKVQSSNLQYFLGDEWILKHEARVKQFVAKYEALAWGRVFDSLPENPTERFSQEEAKEIFKNFNMTFQETHLKQKSCFVPDPKLRDEVKLSIGRKLLSFYGEFYRAQKAYAGGNERPYIRFSPEDIGNYLSDLYFESSDWASVSTSSPSSTSSSHRREPWPR